MALFTFPMILLFLLGFPMNPQEDIGRYQVPQEPVILEDGWKARWGDPKFAGRSHPEWSDVFFEEAGWEPVQQLFTPLKGQAGIDSILWMQVTLPDPLPENPVLIPKAVVFDFEAYIDSGLVARAGNMQHDHSDRFHVTTLIQIDLPADAAGKTFYLRSHSRNPDNIGIVDQIYLVSAGAYYGVIKIDKLISALIGVVLTILALVALVAGILLPRGPIRRASFYMVLAALSPGLTYISSTFVARLVFPVPELWYYMLGAFYFFPVGILGIYEIVIGKGPKGIISILKWAHLAIAVLIVLLDILGISIALTLSNIVFGVLLISMITMVVVLIPALREGDRTARLFGVGSAFAFLFGMNDTIFLGLRVWPSAPELAIWGMLIFFIFIGIILITVFTENSNRLQLYSVELEDNATRLKNANEQLEQYSRQLEDMVAARTVDLEEKNEALNTALAELNSAQAQIVQSEKMASIGQLAAGIAHEINNPINFVTSNVEPLLRDIEDLRQLIGTYESVISKEKFENQFTSAAAFKSDIDFDVVNDEIDHLLEGIREGAQRTSTIVRSLRSFTWTDEADKQPADIHEGIESTLLIMGNELRHHNISITKRYGSLPPVPCYPSRLNQVFLNILSNAAQAIDGEGDITITTGYEDGNAVVSFKDTGPGFRENELDRVFEPHYSTKGMGKGTGLGLWISQEIMTEHGGAITAGNAPEGGAVVSVVIPIE